MTTFGVCFCFSRQWFLYASVLAVLEFLFVDQAGPEYTEISCLCPTEDWD